MLISIKNATIEQLEHERKKIQKKSFDLFATSLATRKKADQQKILKRIVRSKLDKREQMLEDNVEDMESYAKYFQSIFRNERSKKVTFNRDWDFKDEEVNGIADEIFGVQFIQRLLKFSPRRKAPGISEIKNEILKISSEIVAPILSNWFKFCLLSGTVPKSWSQAIIIPVFKKGEKNDIQNYRPISLLENIRKIYEHCIESHIKETMDPLETQQGGFRENRSTLDQILCLDELIKMYRKKFNQYPIVAYLDIKAAYDSVDRKILYNDCLKLNINPIIVESIKQLFEFNHARIKIGDAFSRTFWMQAGVQQGSILSPLLYSIFIDKLIKEVAKGPGITFEKSRKANSLLYADDLALIARNNSEMNTLLNIADGVSFKNNFKFNLTKCAYTAQRPNLIRLEMEKVNKVDISSYLGYRSYFKGMYNKAQLVYLKDKLLKTVQFFLDAWNEQIWISIFN